MENFILVSANVNGLGRNSDLLKVFLFLGQCFIHSLFLCVQETHLQENHAEDFSSLIEHLKKLKYNLYFNNAETCDSKAGTAIFVKSDPAVTDMEHKIICKGRIQSLNFSYHGKPWTLINVYLKSGSGQTQQRTKQIKEIHDHLKEKSSRNFIIVGDFNFVENKLDTRYKKHFRRSRDVKACEDLKRAYKLQDTYRVLHPNDEKYSFERAEDSARRIDRIYTSENVSNDITKCGYVDTNVDTCDYKKISDHKSTYLMMTMQQHASKQTAAKDREKKR